MKVLLTQTIEKIGIVGSVVEVSEGYARNYLLPKRLGIQPTDGNIKQLEAARLAYEAKVATARAEKEALLAKLVGAEVTLSRAANDEGHLFGSVSKRDIADELVKAGFAVEADDVKLDEPLRRVDTFMVAVQVAGDLKTDVKVWIVREKLAEGATPEAKPAAETPAEA